MAQENEEDFWGNFKFETWDHVEFLVVMEFGQMHRYAEAVENLLIEHGEKTSQNITIPNRVMTEEGLEEFYAEHARDVDEIERAFPKILRYSLFVHSYSFFERVLLRLADDYRRDRQLALAPSELYDKGIERARTYLKKVVAVPFPDTGSAWQDITAFNIIRNQIVHNEGYLPRENNKDYRILEAFAKKWHDDISIEGYEIELHKTFVFKALKIFHTFFDELLAGLKR